MDNHLDYANFDYPEELTIEKPYLLALDCLRELCGKCNSGFLRSVALSFNTHLHALLDTFWIQFLSTAIYMENGFHRLYLQRILSSLFSVIFKLKTHSSSYRQVQSVYIQCPSFQELINHLEQTKNSEVKNRIGIATVLCNVVTIAGATIGPLLLSVFNSLLKQLKISVEYGRTAECLDPLSECTLQDTLIDVMGTFASTLPDYQKVSCL